jgi:integrase
MAQVVERPRGKDGSAGISYQVKWRLGGTRSGAWVSETFSGRAHAESFRLDVEDAGHQWPKGWVKGKGYVAPEPSMAVTFAVVAMDYFTTQAKRIDRGKITPYTVHRYERTYAIHLSETFDALLFADVTPEDVEDWVDVQIGLGFAPKSIRNWHGLLFSIMDHGRKKMRLRPDNPCELTELPEANAREARQVRFFQHGEWRMFRACLKADVHLMVDVLLATGMRWGEVSALRAGDVQFRDNGTAVVHVVRAWGKRAPDDAAPIKHDEFETASWKVGPPKGRRSRYVVIDSVTADELRAVVEDREATGYVFVTRDGNPWRYPEFHSDRWAPARKEAVQHGLEKHATPHMLRHTTVVWSLAEGIRIEVISEMLGHASIQITMDVYGGFVDLTDPAMANAMAKSMLMSSNAIGSVPSSADVEARKIRPGARGVARQRTG